MTTQNVFCWSFTPGKELAPANSGSRIVLLASRM